MAVKTFVGDAGGIAREIKKLYIGDASGIARELNALYVGDSAGVARKVFEKVSSPYELGKDWWEGTINPSLTSTNYINSSARACTFIAYAGGRFIAMGSPPPAVLAYSTDGANWKEAAMTNLSTFSINFLEAIADTFFCNLYTTASTSYIAYSKNGTAWTRITVPTAYSANGIAYDGTTLFACASNYMYTSTDLGKTWNSVSTPAVLGSPMAYGNGKFVRMPSSSKPNTGYYSADGISWTAMTLPIAYRYMRVIYGGDKFVAVNYTNNAILYSHDGITWNTAYVPVDKAWYDVAYGDGVYIAVPSGSKNDTIAYSKDGINWEAVTLPVADSYRAVGFGNGMFVIMSYVATSQSSTNKLRVLYSRAAGPIS